MILGQVVGRVWNERQVSGLEGRRLVAVRVGPAATLVAVDLVEVGTGNTVLVATDEAAQAAVGGDAAGIDAAVVSLVAGGDGLAELLEGNGVSDVIRFIDADCPADVPALGGKGAGLAFLVGAGVRIPPAFVVTADGYREAVGPELRAQVAQALAAIPAGARDAELDEHTARVRRLILDATVGHPLTGRLREACGELLRRTGETSLTVAVRSSSIAEDSADKSFAGEHDTYLWVDGADEVDRRVRECWASLVTSRAVAYRAGAGPADELAMAVVVQQMAPARAAGVFMTLNPVNGDRSKVMIESVLGLGEPLVSGEATPDRFLVDKVTGEIVKREHTDKPTQAVRDPDTGRGVVLAAVEEPRRQTPSLTNDEIAELVRIARLVERAAGAPQDGEFAVLDGDAPGNVRLLQCRPETVWSRKPPKPIAPGGGAMAAVLATLTKTKSAPPAAG